MKPYGDRIAYLRKKHNLTQEELAEQLNISRASLSHYETNRREPDYDTLVRLADFFNVSLDYIMARTEEPTVLTDQNVKEFLNELELSNEQLLDKFTLTIDGTELTQEEAKRFIAFIRAERALRDERLG